MHHARHMKMTEDFSLRAGKRQDLAYSHSTPRHQWQYQILEEFPHLHSIIEPSTLKSEYSNTCCPLILVRKIL